MTKISSTEQSKNISASVPDVAQEILDAPRLEPDVVAARAELLADDVRGGGTHQ